MDTTKHTLNASSITRRGTCIKNLSPFFLGVSIRNVQPKHCERWLTERGSTIAAQTLAHELNAMKSIFDYAARLGLMLTNPAKDIKRRKISQARIVVPTHAPAIPGHPRRHPRIRRPRRQPGEGQARRRFRRTPRLLRMPAARSRVASVARH